MRRHRDGAEALKRLIAFLERSDPSIRTRNHQLANGFIQLDPREVALEDAPLVARAIAAFIAGDAT